MNGLSLQPGKNVFRILPPEGKSWNDFARFWRVSDEKTSVEHARELWKTCPRCVREAVGGISSFIQFVLDSNPDLG